MWIAWCCCRKGATCGLVSSRSTGSSPWSFQRGSEALCAPLIVSYAAHPTLPISSSAESYADDRPSPVNTSLYRCLSMWGVDIWFQLPKSAVLSPLRECMLISILLSCPELREQTTLFTMGNSSTSGTHNPFSSRTWLPPLSLSFQSFCF